MLRLALGILALGLAGALIAVAGGCDLGSGSTEQETTPQAGLPPTLPEADGTGLPPTLPEADGNVLSLASFGTTLYLAGEFTKLGERFGQFAVEGHPGYPKVLGGAVWAVEADGRGGWFVGGDFESVGGETCPRLAHIRAAGTLDRDWCVSPDSSVYELTRAGSRLYVGGGFGRIAGQSRTSLAAFDTGSAELLTWGEQFRAVGCESANEFEVSQIEVSRSSVFIGGCFIEVAGKPRDGIAALDTTTGRLTAWQPRPATGPLYPPSGEKDVPPSVGAWDLAPGGDALFAVTARGIAELDTTAGRAARWYPAPSGGVSDLAVSGSTIYMGGDFDRIDGLQRRNLAAVDVRSGSVTAWRPDANASIDIVVPAGRTVYVAGVGLEHVGGARREDLAAVDSRTGRATSWKPDVSGSWVWDVDVSGTGRVGVAFEEGGVRGSPRSGLAAIDTTTGRAAPWNPRVDGDIGAVAVSGTTLYVGGTFSAIGAEPRDGLAAFDLQTGRLMPWRPQTGGGWEAIAVDDGAVYVVRRLDSTGSYHGTLAAYNKTGESLLWSVSTGEVTGDLSIAIVGSAIYVPREFDVLAVEAATGKPLEPSSTLDWVATALAGDDQLLYVATIDFPLLALDSASSSEDWRVRPDRGVASMTIAGGVLYISGYFEFVSGEFRKRFAALDAETGELKDWHAIIEGRPISDIDAMHVLGSTLYVGGDFEGHLVAVPAVDS